MRYEITILRPETYAIEVASVEELKSHVTQFRENNPGVYVRGAMLKGKDPEDACAECEIQRQARAEKGFPWIKQDEETQ